MNLKEFNLHLLLRGWSKTYSNRRYVYNKENHSIYREPKMNDMHLYRKPRFYVLSTREFHTIIETIDSM